MISGLRVGGTLTDDRIGSDPTFENLRVTMIEESARRKLENGSHYLFARKPAVSPAERVFRESALK